LLLKKEREGRLKGGGGRYGFCQGQSWVNLKKKTREIGLGFEDRRRSQFAGKIFENPERMKPRVWERGSERKSLKITPEKRSL